MNIGGKLDKNFSMDFRYGEDFLTVSKVFDLLEGNCRGRLSENQRRLIVQSNKDVIDLSRKSDPIYGVNTGFGPLCTTKISTKDTQELQRKLLISHACGVGEPLEGTMAKSIMILKVHSLSKGFSGISLAVIERIIWMIENEVIPVIPSQGSVGASGDLAPLAHCFLPLIGEGEVIIKNKVLKSSVIREKYGLQPVTLDPKDGLALINGTQFIAAHGVHAVKRLHNSLTVADISASLMIEALHGSAKPFMPEIHELRPFKGQLHVAERIYNMLVNSEINHSHQNCSKVQDPYSLRCVPQVHGASRDAWLHLREKVEIEINSVTDNPIVLSDHRVVSGGNFHGQPLAMTLDYAGLAASEMGNISERRIYLSLLGNSEGVPKLLMYNLGLNSGFMILQYTAAALVSENKSLCFPASADSIPTSLGQEDHVSMGSISGRKTLQIIGNLEKILGIELMAACQAFEFRFPLKSYPLLHNIHSKIRTEVPFMKTDELFYAYLDKIVQMVKDYSILNLIKLYNNENNGGIGTTYEELFEIY